MIYFTILLLVSMVSAINDELYDVTDQHYLIPDRISSFFDLYYESLEDHRAQGKSMFLSNSLVEFSNFARQ